MILVGDGGSVALFVKTEEGLVLGLLLVTLEKDCFFRGGVFLGVGY